MIADDEKHKLHSEANYLHFNVKIDSHCAYHQPAQHQIKSLWSDQELVQTLLWEMGCAIPELTSGCQSTFLLLLTLDMDKQYKLSCMTRNTLVSIFYCPHWRD